MAMLVSGRVVVLLFLDPRNFSNKIVAAQVHSEKLRRIHPAIVQEPDTLNPAEENQRKKKEERTLKEFNDLIMTES